MKSIPAQGNPFQYDLFHMGYTLGTNLIVMFPNHPNQECPYIIINNLETGERIKIAIKEEEGESAA